MKRSLIVVLLALGATGPAFAAELGGVWHTKEQSAKVAFEPCGGKVCAKFVWLKEDAANGAKPSQDVNNPNPAMRSRRLVGLRFAEFRRNGDGWQGTVYNPEDGQNYAAEVRLLGDGQLEIKGCAGPLCDSEIWTRAH